MAEATESQTSKAPMPPYIAFKTLTDVIERMEKEGPPTQVDPSYLDTYAGGYRPTVIGNLQSMGLLTKAGEPTPTLLGLVSADEAGRKKQIGELLYKVYPDILALPTNSTQSQFLEAFTVRGAQGDTRRKAASFFLKAAKYAGVTTGTHWKVPPASTTGARRRTAKANNGEAGKAEQQPALQQPPADGWGEVVTIDLGAAGRVEVNVGVKWLQLDDETFMALRRAINDMKKLAAAQENPPAPAEHLDEDDEADDEEQP